MSAALYRIVSRADWERAQADGFLPPNADDRRDGFIHLSAADQWEGTLRKHYAGRIGLLLLRIDPACLEPGTLRWETSRGGQAFPHVYGQIPTSAVLEVRALDA